MAETDSLLAVNDLVMRKIPSWNEHYDLEDRDGNKLGEAQGNYSNFRPDSP